MCGSLGSTVLLRVNNRLLASPDEIRKLKYVLVDAASMEPQFFSPSEMDRIVLQDHQIAPYAVPGLLVALVVERSFIFALTRMREAFIEGIGWETKIFPGKKKTDSSGLLFSLRLVLNLYDTNTLVVSSPGRRSVKAKHTQKWRGPPLCK